MSTYRYTREIDGFGMYSSACLFHRFLCCLLSFCYLGERNDLKVRVELFMTGIDLEDAYEIYYTDVHMFAKTTATYNWRIIKKLRLPLASLSLKVKPVIYL